MITATLRHFRCERGEDGIMTVWMDIHDRPVNVFHQRVIMELEQLVAELATENSRAVVFQSARPSGFCAGADVREISQLASCSDAEAVVLRGQQLFDAFENLPMPTIAAIHGPCLGGGLELAMACRYRIALDAASTRLGLPETRLGIIPGWGGTQRLPRLVGIRRSLSMILSGRPVSARAAQKTGLVSGITEAQNWPRFVAEFARSAANGTRPQQNLLTLNRLVKLTRIIPRALIHFASRRVRKHEQQYPALLAAVSAVAAGFDPGRNGMDAERELFCQLFTTETSRNLVQLFLRRERARHTTVTFPTVGIDAPDGRNRAPRDGTFSQPPIVSRNSDQHVREIGVVGAGVMGLGIAQLALQKGFSVVLQDLSRTQADSGHASIQAQLDRLVQQGKLAATERDAALSRLRTTGSCGDLKSCDIVIEAVLEDPAVKRDVFSQLDAVLDPRALIVSNTSALSVTAMAMATGRRDRVAGLHFFNPVHRMDLVEIVRGTLSSDATINQLLQLTRRLGRIPVVTSDSPGFLVNRILFPYLGEAIRMLLEPDGCDPQKLKTIDRELRRFGMPMGPLELLDHVGLDVAAHVARHMTPVIPQARATADLLAELTQRGWLGRKSRMGFYRWRTDSPVSVNPELIDLVSTFRPEPQRDSEPDEMHSEIGEFVHDGLSQIQRRLVYSLINETGFCLQEGVVAEDWMADTAMVLGTGFPPFRGGPLAFSASIGASVLLNNMSVLAARHGSRFKPSEWLVNDCTQRNIERRTTEQTT